MFSKAIQHHGRCSTSASWLAVALLSVALAGCGGSDVDLSGNAGSGSGSGSGTGSGSGGSSGGGSGGGTGGSSGGGSGSGGTTGQPLVYVADQAQAGIYELFLVNDAAPGASTRLNGSLVAGGVVDDFRLSPTGTHVAYIADQDILDRWELYIVDLASPGASTKLNAPLSVGRDVMDFVFSPDGSQVVYRADQDADQRFELYLVDLAQPGQSTRLNASLAADGWVRSGYRVSADGERVLYRANQDETDVTELYLVELDAPGVSAQVNPPLAAGGNVSSAFAFSPDGQQVAYIADQDSDDVLELYNVAVAMPGVSSKLSGELVDGGDVCRFRFSFDSQRVAYCADQDTDGVLELYAVELSSPGFPVKVNPPLPPGGAVTTEYDFTPDSMAIAYMAAQDTADVVEIYLVELAAPGAATKLSAPMTAGGNAWDFRFNSDGSHLSYIADQDTDEIYELYAVDLGNGGTVTKLNGPTAGSGVYDLQYSADDSRVFYISAEDSPFVELYHVDLANPGVSTRLNGNLAAGGEVWDFDIVL
jgi:Tol biopolymer transport system component